MVIYHYQATLKIAQMKYLFFRANENFEFAQMKKMIFWKFAQMQYAHYNYGE